MGELTNFQNSTTWKIKKFSEFSKFKKLSKFLKLASAEIILTTHLPQFEGVYFGLKSQYKIVLNIVKKIFFIVFDANNNIEKLKWLYYIL